MVEAARGRTVGGEGQLVLVLPQCVLLCVDRVHKDPYENQLVHPEGLTIQLKTLKFKNAQRINHEKRNSQGVKVKYASL